MFYRGNHFKAIETGTGHDSKCFLNHVHCDGMWLQSLGSRQTWLLEQAARLIVLLGFVAKS